jgi:hypothetical protein
MVAGRIRTALTHAGTALVLAVVFMRALIPGGFMPSFDNTSGKVAVVMCSASPGHEIVLVDLPGGESEDEDDGAACPFAPCGGTILPERCGALQAAPAVYAFEYRQQHSQAPPAASPLSPNAPPTGPPAFV